MSRTVYSRFFEKQFQESDRHIPRMLKPDSGDVFTCKSTHRLLLLHPSSPLHKSCPESINLN